MYAISTLLFFVAGNASRVLKVTYIRGFKKLLQRRRRQRRLKNEFILYLRISGYPKVIYFVYHCQSYHKTESGTPRLI